MAEAWVAAAAITAGGAVLSGVAKNKADKDARKQAGKDAKAATKDEAKWGSITSQFEKEQDYRYEQLARQNKERGLAEFRKFSTMSQMAPDYQQTNAGIVVPEANNVSNIEADFNKADAINNPKAAGGGGGKSTLEKIDPLGSKILKKLF